jgi:hypothetical protein
MPLIDMLDPQGRPHRIHPARRETFEARGWTVDEVDRPAKSATKADWVEFAVTQGADRGEAEASTKDDLIERYA